MAILRGEEAKQWQAANPGRGKILSGGQSMPIGDSELTLANALASSGADGNTVANFILQSLEKNTEREEKKKQSEQDRDKELRDAIISSMLSSENPDYQRAVQVADNKTSLQDLFKSQPETVPVTEEIKKKRDSIINSIAQDDPDSATRLAGLSDSQLEKLSKRKQELKFATGDRLNPYGESFDQSIGFQIAKSLGLQDPATKVVRGIEEIFGSAGAPKLSQQGIKRQRQYIEEALNGN